MNGKYTYEELSEKVVAQEKELEYLRSIQQTDDNIKNWQKTFDAIEDIVMLVGVDHDIIEINKAGVESLKLPKKEILSRKCYDVVHNTSKPISECPCEASLTTKKTINNEYSENGRTYKLTAYPVFDENNDTKYFTHIVKDITESKKKEAKIYGLSDIIKNSLNEIYIFDMNTFKFIYANNGALKNIGYSLEELKRLTPVDMKPNISYSEFNMLISSLLNYETEIIRMETMHQRKNGSTYDVEINLQLAEFENKEVIVGFVSDISKRKEIEKENFRQKKMFETMFNTIQEGVVITNTNREIQLANKGMVNTFGYNPEELIGKSTSVLYADEEKFEEAGKNIYNQNSSNEKNYITYYKRKSGEVFAGETFGTKLYDENGVWLGNIGIIRDITERMKYISDLNAAKEKAEESEKQLNRAQQTAKVGNWTWYIPENRLWWSDEMYNIFEIDKDTFTGKLENVIDKAIHPDDREAVEQSNYSVMVDNKPIPVEYRIITKDKKIKYVYGLADKILLDENGKSKLLTGIVKDITDYKLVQIELQKAKELTEENEEKYRAMYINAPLSYQSLDENGCFIDINPMWSKTLGYEREEVIGKWYGDFLHQDYVEHFRKNFPAFKKRGYISDVQFKLRRKDNTYIYVSFEGCVGYTPSGKFKQTYCVFKDITEQKALENALIKAKEEAEESERLQRSQNDEIILSNQRLESLLKISQYQTNSIQEILDFALKEAIDLTRSKIGYIYFYDDTKRHFILNSWSEGVMDECQVIEPQTVYDLDSTGCWGEAVRQRKPIILNNYQEENPIKKGTPEGHVQLTKFLTIPVFFEEKIVAVAGVANKETDYNDADIRQLTLLMDTVWKISERVKLLENLEKAKNKAEESDRLKSAFLANMSHEIRTPMNGILGFTQLLLEPELNSEEREEYIKVVHQSGQRMLNTVNDIVEISKIEAGLIGIVKENVDFNKIVEDLVQFFTPEASTNNLDLKIDDLLPENSRFISSDSIKLDSILTNLIKNAIKYTDSGSIVVGAHVIGSEIICYVKDTGIGIHKSRHHAIFERFIQADISISRGFEGSGLGLSITKSYVEMLGGRIWVESEINKGSAFYFSLPTSNVSEDKETANTKETSNNKKVTSKTKKLKILLAEDDKTSRDYITILIKDIACEIVYATNGDEVLEIYQNQKDIDLILMDIKMPGIDGYEATREIRKFDKDIVIIAQTAYAFMGDKEKAIEAGCNEYISKPIKKEKLYSLLKKYFFDNHDID